MTNNTLLLFNNKIELGLRVLVILYTTYPKSLDLEMINFFDYFSVHTSDIGGDESLHSPVPNRFGELSVKRELLQSSLEYLILKGLVEQSFSETGIEYLASESAAPFIDALNEKYTLELLEKNKWVVEKFDNYSPEEIKEYVNANQYKWGSEISFCSVGVINE